MSPQSRSLDAHGRFWTTLESLAAEDRFLLALARPELSSQAVGVAVAAASVVGFDWRATLNAAAHQWLSPLLAAHVRKSNALAQVVPRDVREQLALAGLTSGVRRDRFERALEPVLRTLRATGTPLCLLKGAALLQYAYDPGERPINDYDVLVRPSDLGRVCDALEACGFAVDADAHIPGRRNEEPRYFVALSCVFEGVVLVVGLHWRMYPATLAFAFDCDQVLERGVSVWLKGEPTFAACHEDTLVHYATQLARDGLRKSLLRLVDIAALASNEALDFEEVLNTARAVRATRATGFALLVASALGAQVPDDIFRRLGERTGRNEMLLPWLIDARWWSVQWEFPYAIELVLGSRLVDAAPASPGGGSSSALRSYLQPYSGTWQGRLSRVLFRGGPVFLALCVVAVVDALEASPGRRLASVIRNALQRPVNPPVF